MPDAAILPRAYVSHALVVFALHSNVLEQLDTETIAHLIESGAGFGGTFEQREAAVALTRACEAFVDAAKTARERGVL